MDFNECQLELLFNAWALAARDRGMVVTDEAVPEAEELVDHDWLERRPLENGDVAYFWTPQAETAWHLHDLVASTKGRQN